MVKIRATDDLGAGLRLYPDPFGTTYPLFDPALSATELRRFDRGGGQTGYAFDLVGDPDITRASATTVETASSVTIDQVVYKSAANTPLIVIQEIGLTWSDTGLPPDEPLDLTDVVPDFLREGRVTLAGDDLLIGNSFDDFIKGLAGDDQLIGNAGDDSLYGGDGTDLLHGGTGADLLDGGAGIDTASYTKAATGVLVDLLDDSRNRGEAAGDQLVHIENLTGSSRNDGLHGTDDANVLMGLAGDDRIFGRGGDDHIDGGGGDDRLNGGTGDDTLIGGAGNDTIKSLQGRDIVDAGSGDDLILANELARIDGGDGYDTADFSGSAERFYINESYTTSLISIEHVIGTAYQDILDLVGRDHDTTIESQDGNDWIETGNGNNTVFGGDGKDTIFGGDGDDVIDGGDGNDEIDGGRGDDIIDAGAGNDVIEEDDGNDQLFGGFGSDTITYWGSDTVLIDGGHGNDTLNVFGGTGTVTGGDGNDQIAADHFYGGSTTMDGGDGDDTLILYQGEAEMTGGAGTDRFEINSSYSHFEVTITDWDEEEVHFQHDLLFDPSQQSWSDYDPTAADLLALADVDGSDTVLTFDGPNGAGTVTFTGLTDPDQLADYLFI